MSELLLGIDEGTSAVKAVLYDEDLRPVAEARREKPLSHPRSGWVEQDPEAVLVAVVDAVAELLREADGEIVACGLDHQGESVLAWDAESGDPLTPIVTWQDKRSQEMLDELEADGRAELVRERSRLPLDPYFSAGKLAWLLRNDERVASAVEAGTARLGTVDAWLTATCSAPASRPTSRPRRAPSSRCRASRTGTPSCSRSSVCRTPRCRRSWTPPASSASCATPTGREPLPLRARVVDQQAALAGAGCVEPGRVKATYGTGVFVLANVGEELPDGGAEGLFPTVAWRIDGTVEFALDGGVFTAGALLNWLSRDLGLAARRSRRSPRSPPRSRTATACASCPRSPGSARPGGARKPTPSWPGLSAGARPGHIARAALESIAWRVADILAVVSEHTSLDVLRVDGGLTRDPLLLQLQADTGGVPVQRGAVDATAAGSAALAAVGAGSGARQPRSPSGCPWASGSSRSATTPGASASTPSGAAS